MGLSFSVAADVRPVPRSLGNIFDEYQSDLGLPKPANGDLTPWSEQGVMLLNRVLTVRPGSPASHRGKGWEIVTECAIRALVARDAPLVAILWGRDAATLKPMLGPSVPTIESVHRPHCRPRAASLVPNPSAGRMSCWSVWAHSRSTGGCRNALVDGSVRGARRYHGGGGDRWHRAAQPRGG